MQGRLGFVLTATAMLALAGCSSKELLKADCHSCTVDDQEWTEFAWGELTGHWRGSVENLSNVKGQLKKEKKEQKAEFTFVQAADFFKARGGSSCTTLPGNSVVMNGLFWESGSGAREYEAFVPVDDNKVSYGRISFEKVNGQELCHFRHYGRVMGKNRLNLPSISFSDRAVNPGRSLASVGADEEISVEFLRLVPEKETHVGFQGEGRRPAATDQAERPQLMLRVFRVTTKTDGKRGEWSSTREYIYRLWKME
jgi:hypothetical protein